jgi:hypothetical protein
MVEFFADMDVPASPCCWLLLQASMLNYLQQISEIDPMKQKENGWNTRR